MHPRFRQTLVLALVGVAVAATAGCQTPQDLKVEEGPVVEEATTTVATTSVEPTTVTPPPVTPPPVTPPAASKWPAKIDEFAKKFSGPVWYPSSLPTGYKAEAIDVAEFEKGAGLVCDVILTAGEKEMIFTQGSATSRDYDIVSVGKVPWGTEDADVVHEDPEDTTSPKMIVKAGNGTFIELVGEDFTKLKALAASMARVK